ncbi:alpha/beta hydrolase [Patulibacter defluvii]|uniref:alpha/beta hydrolase n=1 Tax=Patulibacter defluvii TaxID=3095358 RepID=UPI002A75689D|nr:alpha/beta fold hydrolase [Patulibacter sp. DM4]
MSDARGPLAARTVVADGLTVDLYDVPDPVGGVVLLHGAGSRRQNHAAVAAALQTAGLAVAVPDQRGHGDSAGGPDGRLDGRAVEDVATVAALLPPGPRLLRGASMGGLLALLAAERVGARAVVAICPAAPRMLAARLAEGAYDAAVDPAPLRALLDAADPVAAVAALGERLLLVHAAGDEVVPVAHSRALHAQSGGRSSLVVLPGGDHPSTGHDPAVVALGARFLRGWAAEG